MEAAGQGKTWLEVASYGCELSNLQLVERAAQKIVAIGGELATATQVRVAIAPEEHGIV